MRKIREILRLRYEKKCTHRSIAKSVGISPSTVSEYLARTKAAGLSWPLPVDLDEETLHEQLFPPTSKTTALERPKPDPVWIHQELKRKGVTLLLLWREYRSQHPTGYHYSRFCQCYRAFASKLKPSMRLRHRAGESLFVDYSGLTMPWVDKTTGEIHQAEIFVAVLGASNYTFVYASESQSLPHWIDAHRRAFEFIGGVPVSVVPDNLKAGVTKAHLYDPDINPTYQDMAIHYNVAIIPTRVRSPKDKSKVEVGVQGIQRWILAPLRDHTFFSVAEINTAISTLLTVYNERAFQQLPGSRRSQFIAVDKPALKALPLEAYQFAEWKKAKAGIDYHVAVNKHYYSVPHQRIKDVIDVRITERLIECFFNGERIAVHQRCFRPGHSTLKAHMPVSHRDHAEWTPERLHSWANKIGTHTAQLIDAVIKARPVPEQAYRACLGILRLAKRYTEERLENAAKRALLLGATRYKNIASILENGLDKQPLLISEEAPVTEPIVHNNIRGATYYESTQQNEEDTVC